MFTMEKVLQAKNYVISVLASNTATTILTFLTIYYITTVISYIIYLVLGINSLFLSPLLFLTCIVSTYVFIKKTEEYREELLRGTKIESHKTKKIINGKDIDDIEIKNFNEGKLMSIKIDLSMKIATRRRGTKKTDRTIRLLVGPRKKNEIKNKLVVSKI